MRKKMQKKIGRLEYSAELLKSLRKLVANDASETVLLHLKTATELAEREAYILRLQVREGMREDA